MVAVGNPSGDAKTFCATTIIMKQFARLTHIDTLRIVRLPPLSIRR